jgi:hypothetical protein
MITISSDASIKTFRLGGGHKIVLSSSKLTISSAPTPNVAFMTSASGTANLSDWADAGGATGLEAANAICQERANAAGLPGNFKAWASTSTTDAYCNVHNLTGRAESNCGLADLPVAAGPWVRTDGMPFAPTIDVFTIYPYTTYTPLLYNEFGVMNDTWTNFTNTEVFGTMEPNDLWDACSDWTDGTTAVLTNTGVTGGSQAGTMGSWASSQGYPCNTIGHLMCMQTGAGTVLPTVAAAGKKVFVTSVADKGDLHNWADANGYSGIQAGAAICQTRAQLGGLANHVNFVAWLSDSSNNAIDSLGAGPWVRLDGIKIADDKTDLTDGSLFTSISQDEFGNYSAKMVWTGTDSEGINGSGYNCSSWTNDTGASGGSGISSNAGFNWTDAYLNACASSAALYCFEN